MKVSTTDLLCVLGATPAPAPPAALTVQDIPHNLLAIEVVREAATIAMLVTIALLGARRARERWALFLYVFALWDLAYYVDSLGTPPVLTDDERAGWHVVRMHPRRERQ